MTQSEMRVENLPAGSVFETAGKDQSWCWSEESARERRQDYEHAGRLRDMHMRPTLLHMHRIGERCYEHQHQLLNLVAVDAIDSADGGPRVMRNG